MTQEKNSCIIHTMFNKHDIKRNECQLFGRQAKRGYDWWWHSFTAYHEITNEPKAFYIEFFLCNPKLKGSDAQPKFGQLHVDKPSYLMVNVGTWGEEHFQLHRFFSWDDIKVKFKAPFSVEARDCYLTETETRGSVNVNKEDNEHHPEWMSDDGSISWDLKIKKDIAFNVGYGAGWLFRKLQLFEMFWHAEGMKSYFEGKITCNNQNYLVRPDSCYGYSDKNWGKDFTSPWVWLSSNNLIDARTNKKLTNSVFDIGGGCPKVGPIALKRKLLSAFYYEGRCYEFNFSKFWTNTKTKFNCYETDTKIIWHVEQKTWLNRMVTDVYCDKKDMLLINYEAPNGKKLHNRLWNGGNGIGKVRLYHKYRLLLEAKIENVGCEFGEYDR